MKFKEFGNNDLPTIVLIHGGGLSWWSWKHQIDALKNQYHVVTPIIDGHGEDGETTFKSISDSADNLIAYIDSFYAGKVYAICGLSIGAQIVVEVISRRKEIAQKAVIESALVYPMKLARWLAIPAYQLCYGLVKKRWYSKIQAKALYIPDDMMELYYRDSCKISKQSLINITLSNSDYRLNRSIEQTNVKALILVAEKEPKVMKRSAQKLNEMISDSQLKVIYKSGHGEISLLHYEQHISILLDFLTK